MGELPNLNKLSEDEVTEVLRKRSAVDGYREQHILRHKTSLNNICCWRGKIFIELIREMCSDDNVFLKLSGELIDEFLDEFFNNSTLLNMQELGYNSKDEFINSASEEDRILLDQMWR